LIGVDHWIHRNREAVSCHILVVGSRSQTGLASLSYDVIQYMHYSCNFVIDMYDPFEYNAERVVTVTDDIRRKWTITYRRHRGCYIYNKEDALRYDILFDDAFIVSESSNVSHRKLIDPHGYYSLFRDYSIKRLPSDQEYFLTHRAGLQYTQCAITKAKETRQVKFPREYGPYKYTKLGQCSLCAELVYQIKSELPDDLVDFVLSSHNRHHKCTKGNARRRENATGVCCSGSVVTSGPRIWQCYHNSTKQLYQIDSVTIDPNRIREKVDISKIDSWGALDRVLIEIQVSDDTTVVDDVIYMRRLLPGMVARMYDFQIVYKGDLYVSIPRKHELVINNVSSYLFRPVILIIPTIEPSDKYTADGVMDIYNKVVGLGEEYG